MTLSTASCLKRSPYIMGQGPSTHRGQSALAASPPTTQKPKEPPGKDQFSKDSPRRSRGALIANKSTAIVTAAFPPLKLRWQPYVAIPLEPPRQKKDTPPPRHYTRCGGKYCIPQPSSEGKKSRTRRYRPGSPACRVGQRKRKQKLSRCQSPHHLLSRGLYV